MKGALLVVFAVVGVACLSYPQPTLQLVGLVVFVACMIEPLVRRGRADQQSENTPIRDQTFSTDTSFRAGASWSPNSDVIAPPPYTQGREVIDTYPTLLTVLASRLSSSEFGERDDNTDTVYMRFGLRDWSASGARVYTQHRLPTDLGEEPLQADTPSAQTVEETLQ